MAISIWCARNSYINQRPHCVFKAGPYHAFKSKTFPAVLLFSSVILPLIIITTGNIAIVIKVKRSRRRIAPTTSSTQSTDSTSRHLVVITLLISSAFVLTTVPFFAGVAISSGAFDNTSFKRRQVVFSVFLTLQNINFATNFYLYILSGRRFRELFISAIMCNKNRTPAPVTTGQKKSSLHS